MSRPLLRPRRPIIRRRAVALETHEKLAGGPLTSPARRNGLVGPQRGSAQAGARQARPYRQSLPSAKPTPNATTSARTSRSTNARAYATGYGLAWSVAGFDGDCARDSFKAAPRFGRDRREGIFLSAAVAGPSRL